MNRYIPSIEILEERNCPSSLSPNTSDHTPVITNDISILFSQQMVAKGYGQPGAPPIPSVQAGQTQGQAMANLSNPDAIETIWADTQVPLTPNDWPVFYNMDWASILAVDPSAPAPNPIQPQSITQLSNGTEQTPWGVFTFTNGQQLNYQNGVSIDIGTLNPPTNGLSEQTQPNYGKPTITSLPDQIQSTPWGQITITNREQLDYGNDASIIIGDLLKQ